MDRERKQDKVGTPLRVQVSTPSWRPQYRLSELLRLTHIRTFYWEALIPIAELPLPIHNKR